MQNLIELRHILHAHPELSGQEVLTNRILNEWVKQTRPDLLIEKIGGYGLAAIYKGAKPGKRILIRGDIDALHIPEPNDLPYRSQNQGVSHKCGHDGHATILCGLAQWLGEQRPDQGEVVLLFQPAEETGHGAQAILNDPQFAQIKPDVAYGLHNLPSFEKGQILVKEDCFAAASFGLKMTFDGRTAHASQPETGHSPSELLALLIHQLEKKREQLKAVKPLTTFVITHAVLGEETFGVAPGHAEIWLTLRSHDDRNLQLMATQIIELCRAKSKDHLFDFNFSEHEAFAATNSDPNCVKTIEQAAKNLELNLTHLNEPFRWSEDFGRFGSVCPIGFFGLGSGTEQPALHNPEFDFPDDILEVGMGMFWEIIRLELEGANA
ncbi:MAG: amidohydrolase [Bacteroidales bacterium]|nr:amidohydrolase [Bacteroidales bacterium]